MSIILVSNNEELTHLRGDSKSLCGKTIKGAVIESGDLTCKECASIALRAIETSTKNERRAWRNL